MSPKAKISAVCIWLIALGFEVVQGQVPINPQNRIVEGQIYYPPKSRLWMDLATNVTENCSSLKVTSVGQTSIACDVFREVLDDGGQFGIYRVIGERYEKTIIIFHHPLHPQITTGSLLYEGRFKKRGETPLTRPILAMRVSNWRTNDLVFEAYDCGLPDTIENRKNTLSPQSTNHSKFSFTSTNAPAVR